MSIEKLGLEVFELALDEVDFPVNVVDPFPEESHLLTVESLCVFPHYIFYLHSLEELLDLL